MTSTTLTAAEQKKLDAQVEALAKTLKLKATDDAGRKNLGRYCDKYLRFKLGRRGTGPHAHGFSGEQRKQIREALHAAFNIKAPERKAPAPAKGGKKAPAKGGKKAPAKRSTRKSASQLAGEQQARAEA